MMLQSLLCKKVDVVEDSLCMDLQDCELLLCLRAQDRLVPATTWRNLCVDTSRKGTARSFQLKNNFLPEKDITRRKGKKKRGRTKSVKMAFTASLFIQSADFVEGEGEKKKLHRIEVPELNKHCKTIRLLKVFIMCS